MRAFVLVLAVAFIAGCEGPVGPPGEMGEQGVQGPEGQPGMNGMDGMDGADGMNGAAGLDVVASTLCQGSVRNSQGNLIYSVRYSIIEYTSGAVWVSCAVANGFTQSSASSFYDATQNGAAGHGCTVATDETGSFGWWNFRLVSTGYVTTYNDIDSTNDGYTFEFDGPSSTQDGCTTYTP